MSPRTDWGPAATDVRNSASINGSWQLPIGPQKHFLNRESRPVNDIVAAWTTSAIVTLQTGFPFSPQLGYNAPGNGDSRNPIRPGWNPSFTGNLYPHTVGEYFNPNAFIAPTVTFATATCGASDTCGTYGNVSRDSLIGPGLSELDFSAIKNSQITERLGLQFRAEFFNILNRANFLTPNEVVYSSATQLSPTAGVVTATSTTSRQIQFGAKLSF
jgi:hypothetical protein